MDFPVYDYLFSPALQCVCMLYMTLQLPYAYFISVGVFCNKKYIHVLKDLQLLYLAMLKLIFSHWDHQILTHLS